MSTPTVEILVNEIVLIPKGSLTQMIDSMIDGVLVANSLGLPVSMIWTHEQVQYDMLYLNNIAIVDYSYLTNKNYIYNPDPQELKLMINSLKKTSEQNIFVIESSSHINLDSMTATDYSVKRKSCYTELWKDRMSGSLLGQINMIPFPKRPFVHGGSSETLKHANVFALDTSEVVISKEEVMYYVRVLAASRADLLICDRADDIDFFVDAATVDMTPLVIRGIDSDRVHELLDAKGVRAMCATNFADEEFVLFPNAARMFFSV